MLSIVCAQILGRISEEGVFLEQMETNPAKYLPDVEGKDLGGDVVQINLNKPMADVLQQLSQHPIKTRLSLTGTLVVGRDIAHAKLKERLDAGEGLPQYMKDHPVYYAGPAKTPEVRHTAQYSARQGRYYTQNNTRQGRYYTQLHTMQDKAGITHNSTQCKTRQVLHTTQYNARQDRYYTQHNTMQDKAGITHNSIQCKTRRVLHSTQHNARQGRYYTQLNTMQDKAGIHSTQCKTR